MSFVGGESLGGEPPPLGATTKRGGSLLREIVCLSSEDENLGGWTSNKNKKTGACAFHCHTHAFTVTHGTITRLPSPLFFSCRKRVSCRRRPLLRTDAAYTPRAATSRRGGRQQASSHQVVAGHAVLRLQQRWIHSRRPPCNAQGLRIASRRGARRSCWEAVDPRLSPASRHRREAA